MTQTPAAASLDAHTAHPGDAADQPASGLRETKKLRAREAMHRAAVELLAEHGAPHVTVEMIAERAGVSTRTFFNYWPSKESAMLGLSADRNRRAVELLRERPAKECPRDALRAVMVEIARGMPDEAALRQAKRAAMDREPTLQQLSGRQMATLQAELTDVLAQRIAAPDAHDRALVFVQLAFGAARSAFALSMTHGATLLDEFDRVYGYIDDGVVGA